MRKLTNGFKKYLLTAENAPLLAKITSGEDVTGTLRHDSPEGGTDTVGFGYKLSATEHRTGMIDGEYIDEMGAEEAMLLFKKSLEQTDARLARKVDNIDSLLPRQYEALLDFEYNVKGGITTFPKYTNAVLREEWQRAEAESVRHFTDEADGLKYPLTQRNNAWIAQFNNRFAATGYGQPETEAEADRILMPDGGKAMAEAKAAQETQQAAPQEQQQAPQQQQQQQPQALADNLPTKHLRGQLAPDVATPGMLDPNFKYYGK